MIFGKFTKNLLLKYLSFEKNMYICVRILYLFMARIDRAALRQKIQNLTGLTDDERAALLQLAAEGRSYGLVWEDREEAVEERLREELPVLVEDKELALIDGGQEAPNHILIEGDNLEALTALSYTHEGRVDVIYIDPPYNTGNKDFVYNDSFVDSEDSYRHSKWLSFMSKRLRIAKRLLSDRGVIFISIDDNEQANLKLLCDQVFGERNFVAQVVWERAYAPVNLKKHFSESHDYIICYAKRIEDAVCNGLPRTTDANDRYSNPDNDPRGVWKAADSTVGPVVKDKLYEIKLPSGRTVTPPSGRCWVYTEERFYEMVADGRIWFGPNGDSSPSVKKFLTEVKQGITPMTIWKYSEVGHSQDAAKEVKDIFGGESRFTYPKSMRLIKRIAGLYGDKSSTVLDFFAGSGTTLHAVMQLNKEDGGKRQCILVTNNENNICREVTYERNKRVIEGYTTPKGGQVEGLHENNLRYYRTRLLPRERTNRNMRALVSAATDLLCIKEGVFEELNVESLALKAGLTPKDVRLFSDGERAMMVVYNEEAIPDIVDWLLTAPATNVLTHSRTNAIKVYVFSPGSYAWDDDFAPVLDRVELCALPEAIYQAYKNVLPKKRAQRTTDETSPKGGEE